jgi:hypothetical protein
MISLRSCKDSQLEARSSLTSRRKERNNIRKVWCPILQIPGEFHCTATRIDLKKLHQDLEAAEGDVEDAPESSFILKFKCRIGRITGGRMSSVVDYRVKPRHYLIRLNTYTCDTLRRVIDAPGFVRRTTTRCSDKFLLAQGRFNLKLSCRHNGFGSEIIAHHCHEAMHADKPLCP